MASSAHSSSTTAPAASSTTHWPSHPIADLFPRMSPEERAELKKDMLERAEQGVDPLEHSILLFDGQIVDGRHRDAIWKELAEEDACNGFFNRNLPPTELVTDKHGTLGAWMRAKSANMVHRHIPADQKAAIVLKAMKMFPEIKAAFDQIKEENAKRKKKGKALAAGDQRGNTAKAIGDVAGVGATTVKAVASVQKDDPAKFEELVKGNTTAKKALNEIKNGKKAKPESNPKPESEYPESEDTVGEGDPISDADVWEEPEGESDHVDAPGSQPTLLLDVANTLTQSFTDLLRVMDMLDWSQEDNAMWTKASETLKERTDAFATKVQHGFKKVPNKRKPSKSKPISKDISIRKLKSEYGRCALQVLHEYLKELPRDEGAMRSYRIIKPLPSKEDFNELQRKRFTSTVAELVDDAFGAFIDLAGEIGDWYDNLPEGFQSGDKGCVLEEARSTLDGLSQPDVPESIGESQVFYLPLEDTSSRASRRDDAVGRLQVVVEALNGSEDAETKAFIDELDNAISEAEGVDFPGMY